MAKSGPKNQYSVVNPTGTNAVNYTDNHYMDGDGALYWTGMIAQRVLVKGDDAGDLTSGGGLKWTIPSGQTSATAATLGVDYNSEHFGIDHNGLFVRTSTGLTPSSNGIAINGNGLKGDGISWNATGNANKFSVNYGAGLYINSNSKLDIHRASFVYYEDTYDDDLVNPIVLHPTNGLTLNIGEGLTIGPNSELIVNTSAIVPNISGTNPITVTTSGSNKAIGLDLVTLTDATSYNVSGLEIVTAGGGASAGLKVKTMNHGGVTIEPGQGLTLTAASANYIGGVKIGSNINIGTGSSEGVISVNNASTSQKGVVQLQDSIADSVTDKASTVNAVYDFVHGLDGDGLGWMSGNNANKLKVNTGNGITVSSDTVGLNTLKDGSNNDISGLTLSSGGAYVSVRAGSDIIVNENGVSVDKVTSLTNAGSSKPATGTAVVNYVDSAVATAVADISGREYKIFSSLPTVTTEEAYEANKKYIALIADGDSPDADAYIEYILIRENSGTEQTPVYSYRWERVGNTKFVSDDYVAKTDVLSQADITAIVTDVFGF